MAVKGRLLQLFTDKACIRSLLLQNVYLHRELLEVGEECVYGGGLWKVDESRNAILLYGRSFDFGPPDFDYVRRIEWSGVGGRPAPLFFLPDWPNEDMLIPDAVCVHR